VSAIDQALYEFAWRGGYGLPIVRAVRFTASGLLKKSISLNLRAIYVRKAIINNIMLSTIRF
jgi:hypothetical protein